MKDHALICSKSFFPQNGSVKVGVAAILCALLLIAWAAVRPPLLAAGENPVPAAAAAAEISAPAAPLWVVGYAVNQPPYIYSGSGGAPAGFCVELAEALAKAAGCRVEHRTGTWSEIDAACKRGEITFIGMMSADDDSEGYALSLPYHQVNLALCTRSQAMELVSFANLAGKKVAAGRDDYAHSALEKVDWREQQFSVETCRNMAAALDAVVSGRVDAALVDVERLRHLGQSYPMYQRELRIAPVIASVPLVYAAPAGNEELLKALERAQLRLRMDGTLDRLHRRWFTTPAPRQPLKIAVPSVSPVLSDKVLRVMAERIGHKLEVVLGSVPETNNAVASGQAAGMLAVKEVLRVSDPQQAGRLADGKETGLTTSIYAVYPENAARPIKTWQDLANLRVGIRRNDLYFEGYVNAVSGVKIAYHWAANDSELPALLRNGRVDAVLVNSIIANDRRMFPHAGFQSCKLDELPVLLWFGPRYSSLAEVCGEVLQSMRADGTVAELMEGRYAPADSPASPPRVLMLYSYDPDVSVSRVSNRQIAGGLKVDGYRVAQEYMHLPYSRDAAAENELLMRLRRRYGGQRLGLIVAAGQPAMEFINRYYNHFAAPAPVFFHGIDGDVIRRSEAVPGVHSSPIKIAARETVEALLRLYPALETVYVVNDHTSTGRAVRAEIARQLASVASFRNVAVKYNPNESFNELAETVQTFDDRTVVLLGMYQADAVEGRYVGIEELRRLTGAVPVYGLFSRYQSVGQIGGKMVDAEMQAEAILHDIRRMLPGTSTASDTAVHAEPRWVFSGAALRRHGVSERRLPSEAEVTELHTTLAEFLLAHPLAFGGLLAFLALFLAGPTVLYLYRRRGKAVQLDEKENTGRRRMVAVYCFRGVLLAAVLFLPLAVIFLFAFHLLEEQAKKNLTDAAIRLAETLSAEAETTQAKMQRAAAFLPALQAPPAVLSAELQTVAKNFSAHKAVYVNTAGSGIDSHGRAVNLAGETFFIKALQGTDNVSSLLSAAAGEEEMYVLAVPVYRGSGKQPSGVLAVYRSCQFLRSLALKRNGRFRSVPVLVDGNGLSMICNPQSKTWVLDALRDDVLYRESPALMQLLKNMLNRQNGATEFYYDGDNWFGGYAPELRSDWSVAVVAKRSLLWEDSLPLALLILTMAGGIFLTVMVFSVRAALMQSDNAKVHGQLQHNYDELNRHHRSLAEQTKRLTSQANLLQHENREREKLLISLRGQVVELLGAEKAAWAVDSITGEMNFSHFSKAVDNMFTTLAERMIWFQALVDHMVLPAVVLDNRRQVIFTNRAYRDAPAPVSLELYVRAYDKFAAADSYRMLDSTDEKDADVTETITDARDRILLHDTANNRWLQMRLSWVLGKDGESLGCLVSAEDVTAARMQEINLRLVIENMPVGCLLFDHKDRSVILVNSVLLRMLGVSSREEFFRNFKHYTMLKQPDGQDTLEVLEALENEALAHGTASREIVFNDAVGEKVPCRLTNVAVTLGSGERSNIEFVVDLRGQQAAERLSRNIFDNAPTAIIFYGDASSKGQVIDCNPAALSLFGAPDKETFIRDFLNYNPKYQMDGARSAEKMHRIIDYLTSTESGGDFEWMHRTADGKPLPVFISIRVIDTGGRKQYMAFIFDMRKLKNAMNDYESRTSILSNELRQVRTDMQTVVDYLPMPVLICTASDYNITYINREMARFIRTNDPETQVCNHSVYEFMPGGDCLKNREELANFSLNYAEGAAEGNFCEFDTVRLTCDGKEVPIHLYVIPLIYQGQPSLMTIGRGRMEETGTVAGPSALAALEAATTASRLKSDMLAVITRELRTPLDVIQGLTGMAMQGKSLPGGSGALAKIHTSASLLLAFVQDILDLSKLEAGKLSVDKVEFDLETVAASALNLGSARLAVRNEVPAGKLSALENTLTAQHQIDLILAVDPAISGCYLGDPVRVWQALKIIIDVILVNTNGGMICLEIRRSAADAALPVEFYVRGSRPGAADTLPEPVTPALVQTLVGAGGNELRLNLCSQLAALMGGTLTRCMKDGCVEYCMKLPLPAIAPAEKRPGTEGAENNARRAELPAGLRVLLADDQPFVRNTAAAMLSRELGVPVETAAGAEEALAMISRAAGEKRPFGLVVIDYIMPEINGLQLAQTLRDNAAPVPVCILLSGGREQLADETLWRASGAAGVVEKPFTARTLGLAVRRALASSPEGREWAANVWRLRLRGKKALVVDDDSLNLKVMQEMLESFGIAVTAAADGAEAFELVQHDDFSWVLLDVQMPVVDGYETARRIRRLPALRFARSLPIIAVTSRQGKDERERCLAAGMSEFLSKPVNIDDLEKVLLHWLDAE